MSEAQLPEPAAVPLDDRGLAYGDGLFETVLVRDGIPLLWAFHLARLARGCEALGLPMPARDRLDSLPERVGKELGILKLILTRGSGGRGYLPPSQPSPRLLWQTLPFAPQPSRWRAGVRVRLCRLRLGLQPALAGLKHLNRLENVLARREWQDPEVAEGLLCDSDGRLIEATCMNLFWQRGGRLETPRLDRCGVAGTLRAALMEALPIAEVEAGPEALLDAELAWLGNSVQGVWPLVRLDDPEGSELKRWWPQSERHPLPDKAHQLLGYLHPDLR